MRYQQSDPDGPASVEAVLEPLRRAPRRCAEVSVVAIDGPSGSGKTTIGLGVAAALGCPVVHMDDLYPGWDGLAASVGLLTDEVLRPLCEGVRAEYRVWDWVESRWGGVRVVPPSEVLVVEGCGASVLPAGGYAALRVWVDADREVRLARGLARDGEAYAPHWHRWAEQEDALYALDGTRARADVVIDTTPRRTTSP